MDSGHGDEHSVEFKRRQRQQWSIGDAAAFGEALRSSAQNLVRRVGVQPGMQVLDIGTGTGTAAIAAATAGGRVVGLDLAPEQFDAAADAAAQAGVLVEWVEGDAARLPYADASFDAVVSAFALMFVPDPHAAAGELLRVLRPGGRFGMTNWSSRGLVQTVLDALGSDALPDTVDQELLPWGSETHVRAFLGGEVTDLQFEHSTVTFLFPDAEEGVRWLEEVCGPVIAARAMLQAGGAWQPVRERIVAAVADLTRDDMPGVWPTADYLITTGTRS